MSRLDSSLLLYGSLVNSRALRHDLYERICINAKILTMNIHDM